MIDTSDRHPSTTQVARHFAAAHLPDHLRPTSEACAGLAALMVEMLPDGPELTTGLRKLLEAKDCFVRAALDRPRAIPPGGIEVAPDPADIPGP